MGRYPIIVLLLGLLVLIAVSHADAPVKVTQVDASGFPDITVYVSVTDERGQPKTDLSSDDFRMSEDGILVEIKEFAGTGDRRAADIVFVFDTTTSMVEEVEGMKGASLSFLEKLDIKQVDYRLGLIDFGDVINRVEPANGRLTANGERFRQWIDGIRLRGGGYDIPEFSLGALQRATSMVFRDDAMRVFILITDAPPHHYGDPRDAGVKFNDPRLTLAHTLATLAEANVTVYVVGPSDPDYEQIVERTGGEFFNIHGRADFTSVIDSIGGIIASQYRITYVTPRPSYDGTRRTVQVEVNGHTATSDYLEQHLINVRSRPMIALILLAPLLLALALPALIRSGSGDGAATGQVEADRGEVPPAAGQIVCGKCGKSSRATAKFCSHCGQPFVPAPSPAPPPSVAAQTPRPIAQVPAQPAHCSRCGQALRPGAKFCGRCGQSAG